MTRARARALAVVAAGVLGAGCAAPPSAPPHPLEGRIVRSDDLREIDEDALIAQMASAQVVYLGERHDDARHHALERRVLERLVAHGARPALGLEIVAADETSSLELYVDARESPHAKATPAERLRAALGWGDEEDWRWRDYGPLLEIAREHALPVFGADLPKALRQRIARVGIDGLNAVERAALAPTPHPGPAYESLMLARIRASHCGHGGDRYLARLFENWTVRNETMARAVDAMIGEAEDGPVVLVAGGGHLRHGLGVPARVARLRPGVDQVQLGFVALIDGIDDPGAYAAPLEHDGARFAPDYELMWFTPPPPEPAEDPCAVFQKLPHASG